eukprot:TRINITY_DN2141_c1_g1_i1.p1 TRINITY_DN2141_c1_g1~~TRINITY_DN2141_c1_g1_i1.p1  ORF type:complete len:636 (+),score=38.25 TRINITY_DN2141_c1_g1_i1:44-1951(+)
MMTLGASFLWSYLIVVLVHSLWCSGFRSVQTALHKTKGNLTKFGSSDDYLCDDVSYSNKWIEQDKLGVGGFGVVFKVQQRRGRFQAVVKKPGPMANPSASRKEALIGALTLPFNTFLVEAYKNNLIVLPFFNGRSLIDKVGLGPIIGLSAFCRVRDILLQIAIGIDSLYQVGISHGDIVNNLQNVMLHDVSAGGSPIVALIDHGEAVVHGQVRNFINLKSDIDKDWYGFVLMALQCVLGFNHVKADHGMDFNFHRRDQSFGALLRKVDSLAGSLSRWKNLHALLHLILRTMRPQAPPLSMEAFWQHKFWTESHSFGVSYDRLQHAFGAGIAKQWYGAYQQRFKHVSRPLLFPRQIHLCQDRGKKALLLSSPHDLSQAANAPNFGQNAECFPNDARVFVQGKGPTVLNSVMPGMRILAQGQHGEIAYDEILGDVHSVEEQHLQVEYLAIKHTGSSLTFFVSSGHLVACKTGRYRLARELVVGDQLLHLGSPDSESFTDAVVIAVSKVFKAGLRAPITNSGTVIVDGVLASTYAADLFQSLLSVSTQEKLLRSLGGFSGVHYLMHVLSFPLRTFLRWTMMAQSISEAMCQWFSLNYVQHSGVQESIGKFRDAITSYYVSNVGQKVASGLEWLSKTAL